MSIKGKIFIKYAKTDYRSSFNITLVYPSPHDRLAVEMSSYFIRRNSDMIYLTIACSLSRRNESIFLEMTEIQQMLFAERSNNSDNTQSTYFPSNLQTKI